MLCPQQQKCVNFNSNRNSSLPTTQQPSMGFPMPQTSSASINGGAPVMVSWSMVGSICVPCIARQGNKMFVPVRIIERKLLQPLVIVYPTVASTFKRPLLTSYYVTPAEAEALTLRLGPESGAYVSGVDLVVSFYEFLSFYAELKALCSRAITENETNHMGGWVQINNSVIPYVNIEGGKYLPLSVVQNAAHLLNNVDRTAFSVRRLSSNECRVMNELCHSAGLLFVVDPTTDVVEILTVCGMAHRTPVVRFLPSEDPFGCAQFMDIPEDAEQQVHVVSDATKQPFSGHCLPDSSMSYQSSSDLKIVDVRGNVMPVQSAVVVNATAVVPRQPLVNMTPSSEFGELTSGTPPIVEPVIFQNRTVSSLRRADGNNYVLLEAICRVFFPSTSVNAFMNCIERVLHIPVTELTPEEERYFIKFYQLPTDCLRCRKLITYENLNMFYPQLKYSFRADDDTLQTSTTTTSSSTSSSSELPPPIAIGSIGVEHQPSVAAAAATNKPNRPRNAARKRRKICNDVILIDDD